MKLAAIYNIWDGVELLRGSIDLIKNDVDFFIFVWQRRSNFGEEYDPRPDMNLPPGINSVLVEYNPIGQIGFLNEKNKRNLGLDVAREFGCTHFLHLDCDEYYEDFSFAKKSFINSGFKGSVCSIITYFKKPTLRFETPDGYYVPFIHELYKDTIAGNKVYPYYVDPTRRINQPHICLLNVTMHHFSWVRKNIERKARNSSAKENIERGTLLIDYHKPEVESGFYVKDFDKKLVKVEDKFNLNSIFS